MLHFTFYADQKYATSENVLIVSEQATIKL